MKHAYSATLIGFLFALSSYLCTWTIVIPIATIIPLGFTIEKFFLTVLSNPVYSKVGTYTLSTFLVLFFILTSAFFYKFYLQIRNKKSVSKNMFIAFLAVHVFVTHPLFYYLHVADDLTQAYDGQFILGIIDTFPFSSIVFLFFGIVLDLMRHYVTSHMSPSTNTTEN